MRTILVLKRLTLCALLFVIALVQENSNGAQLEKPPIKAEEISPAEDLMREHGVLSRILLIYETALNRIETGKEIPVSTLNDAAGIVRRFIEEYHEKLEEDYIFPRFEKKGTLTDLTAALRTQHKSGRALTKKILELSNDVSLKDTKNRTELATCIHKFIRLYRPHKAREDTVLFPALHSIIPDQELAQLGDKFEDRENELFGEGGFEKVVEHVARLEQSFGIYKLSQFTPEE